MLTYATRNPKNLNIIDTYNYMTRTERETAVSANAAAFKTWRQYSLEERCAVVRRIGAIFLSEKDVLARLCTDEMGKPLKEAISEVEKCAAACQYYADSAIGMLGPEEVPQAQKNGQRAFLSYQPLGQILGIMPWNYPYWQVIRFAIPAITGGNSVLLKHADNSTGAALALEHLFRKAQCPEHLFRTLLCSHEDLVHVIRSPTVQAVSLTGSERAGAAVSAIAGSALKKTVMELGGSDAYLILADADIEAAAAICLRARLINNGQSCIAAKRFIVDKKVLPAFTEALIALAKKRVTGDPLESTTDQGPLAKLEIQTGVAAQVTSSVNAGAKIIFQGNCPKGPGYFHPLTLLGEVRPGMAAFDEEVFGPVAAIVSAKDEVEAMQLANHSCYGLGGAIFSRDEERATQLASLHLEAGTVVVNGNVVSAPELPFGGVKNSGYGRELGAHGIKEFINIKTVVVHH